MDNLGRLLSFERLEYTVNSTSAAVCASTEPADYHYDLPSVLWIADQLGIDLLPISWMSALGSVGEGATGQVYQSRIDSDTEFAFKRSMPSPGSDTSDSARYKAIISEMIILRHAAIRDHPHVVDLIGLGWDVNVTDETVWPVLVFRKALFGNLQQFFRATEGAQASFETRIKLCTDMLMGLLAMHSHSKRSFNCIEISSL